MDIMYSLGDGAENAGSQLLSGLADADNQLTGGAIGGVIDGGIATFDSMFGDATPKRPARPDPGDARTKEIMRMARAQGDLWADLEKGERLKWGGSMPGASKGQGALKGPGGLPSYADGWAA